MPQSHVLHLKHSILTLVCIYSAVLKGLSPDKAWCGKKKKGKQLLLGVTLTCKRQRSLKLWNACPTKWVKEGWRANGYYLSLLGEMTVTSKATKTGKQKWEEIRRFSNLRALTLSITHYFLLSARRHTHTVCMSTRFQSTLLKNKLFFSGVRVMMDWFFFPLFSPAFQLPRRQMAAFTMSTLIREWDEPYTSTERHICMGVALPSSLSYLFCLFGFAG